LVCWGRAGRADAPSVLGVNDAGLVEFAVSLARLQHNDGSVAR
jgi:hypothetical protein